MRVIKTVQWECHISEKEIDDLKKEINAVIELGKIDTPFLAMFLGVLEKEAAKP